MHGGLQWFPLTMRDPSEYWRGVVSGQPALDRFLDASLRATACRRIGWCSWVSARAP